MAKRTRRMKGTRRRRNPDATAPIVRELHALTHEVRVHGGLLRKVAAILKVQQPSIAIRPYLREEFEEEVARRFVEKSQRTTTALAAEMKTYPKKVLRAIRRINRRASRREGVEPFHFDPARRSWQLELEILDRKELR